MTTAGTVLVIDDSRTILDSIRTSLGAEGYSVRVATDLPTAVKHVRGSELCIVDFHMPGLDGKSLLVALKAGLDAADKCVFYLYTSDPNAARRAKEFGFDGSFMKKGDATLLGYQVGAVFRTLRMAKAGSNASGRGTLAPKSK